MDIQNHINDLTETLGEHLSALSASSTALKAALNDHRKNLWWSVPSSTLDTEFDHVETLIPKEADWLSVENQLTNIWMESNSGSHQHGLLVCGVAEVLEQFSVFNQAKLNVTQSIKDVKDVLNSIRGTELRESSKSNKDIKNEDFVRAR